MARNKDYSGVELTCYLIDNVISQIDNSEDEDLDKRELINLLEQIRKANSSLRDWGNELYEEKEDLENEVSNLKNQIIDLNEELSSKIDEITSLNEEISNYNDQSNVGF